MYDGEPRRIGRTVTDASPRKTDKGHDSVTEPDIIIDKIDYAERRRQRATERSLARRRKVPVAAIIGAVAVIFALVATDALASWGRIHPGVHIAGVKVGGMRPDEATATLKKALPAKASEPVTVVFGADKWTVQAADVGLGFDYAAMVDEAMGVGRDGGAGGVVFGRLGAWLGASKLPARPQTDTARMATVLDEIAKGTDVDPVDASVDIDGTDARVVPGKNGRGLVRDKASGLIVVALLSAERTFQAPVEPVEVAISDQEADAARTVALRMMDAPAVITHGEKEWEFKPARIAEWVAFRRSDEPEEGAEETSATAAAAASTGASATADVTLVAYVSSERAGEDILEAVGEKVGRPAKDATFSTRGGRVTIIPSQEGIGPDLRVLATELTDELADESSDRTVEMLTARVEPDITTAEAREMGISERIGRYTTTYAAGNRPRVNNIHLLGDSLDGKLIAPGATFSFNKSVGERTAAKGYQEANAIVNGKLVPQLGGGICQVGTTLFNAVYESGLPVIERRNHSFYISHYPKGRDATVSWGGPDLKFKNDTKNWVLVSVSYTSSSITIALYGTDPGYDVDSSVSQWRNVKPFRTEEVKDDGLYEGSKVIEDPGVTGRTITVTRTVQQNGEIIRTDTFVSVYKPKTQVVRVGTRKKPASGTTTSTPGP